MDESVLHFTVHDSLTADEIQKLILTLEGANVMHQSFIEQNRAAIAEAHARLAELQQARAGTLH